ncbi:MAG: hypothetical protein HKN04_03190 [Rhodothermaceae bacterium]|nr:hypothetical protein [Rhodothermaceae bacterium]
MRLFPLLLILLLAAPAQAQFGPPIPDEVVTWTATVRPPSTAEEMTDTFWPGERAYITLTGEILDGWRVYALDTPGGYPAQLTLAALPEGLVRYSVPGEAEPHDGHDTVLDEAYRYHEGRARIWQGVQVSAEAPPGLRVVTGTLRYAACNDEVCIPPRDLPFEVRLIVAE